MAEELFCPICLDDLGDLAAKLQPCQHAFHSQCIRRWHTYAEDLKCPICKTESNKLHVSKAEGGHYTIDLLLGFYVGQIVEYNQRHGSRSTESLRHEDTAFINVESLASQISDVNLGAGIQERNRFIQCGICGSADKYINKYCGHCETLYHESCLRSLACEVGDPESWHQCVEDYTTLQAFIMPSYSSGANPDRLTHLNIEESVIFEGRIRNRRSVETEQLYRRATQPSLEELKQFKRKIQSHVRKVLYEYYGKETNGVQLSQEQFTTVNRTVSRNLYRLSNYEYKDGILDYDNLARRGVSQELIKIGYNSV